MPLIALGTLSVMIALPTLSNVRLYAANSERFSTVTVHPGESLWAIAASHTTTDGDVQETLDQIAAANHLVGSSVVPGQHLRIPQ
ncbi:MAG: hypothetical protein DLM50_08670 [Candidatus Meridianibacter frigidus]|nr:MAG: hypothetical protein DLM50_08670 [Candidatus Eremiobacteraeota bacterium]